MARLPQPKGIPRISKAARDLRIGITGPLAPSPILAEAVHIAIMVGDRLIEMQNLISLSPQAATHFGFFAGSQCRLVASYLFEDDTSDKCASTARIILPWLLHPVDIEGAIVKGSVGIDLLPPPIDDGDRRIGKFGESVDNKTRMEGRVPIEKKDELPLSLLPPCIAGEGCCWPSLHRLR